jgi:hypothetical protein
MKLLCPIVFSDPFSRSVTLSRMFFPFLFCFCVCRLGFEGIFLHVLHISWCICYGKSCKNELAGFSFFLYVTAYELLDGLLMEPVCE